MVVGSSGTSVATVQFLNKLYFQPLGISNQASGSYGVEYDWLVHKTVVGASSKTVDEGQTTTFQYKVELEALPEGPPAGKEVHGTATVTNPNPAHAPDMRATLSISGDLACHFLPSNAAIDVDPGTAGVQVDVGDGSTAYDYTCDPGAGALVGGTTTAKVTWDQTKYPQAAAHPGEATAQATYAITVQPKIDEYASVTDTFGSNATTRSARPRTRRPTSGARPTTASSSRPTPAPPWAGRPGPAPTTRTWHVSTRATPMTSTPPTRRSRCAWTWTTWW